MARRGPQWDDDPYDAPKRGGQNRGDNGGGPNRGDNGGGPNRGDNGGQPPVVDDFTEMLYEVQALQQEGRIDEAIELCEEIVASDGRSDARYYLAWMYQEEHLWDSAVEHYMALLDDADYALSCYYALGQCYRAKGDLKNAARYFDEAVDRVDLDQLNHDEAEQLIQLCDESAQTHFELGNSDAGETVYSALLGFLRSRGWQDRVAQVDRMIAEHGLPPATPSGRIQAVQPPPRPSGSGVHQAPPVPVEPNNGSGFLTDHPPAVQPPPRPGASGVHQVPPSMPPPPVMSGPPSRVMPIVPPSMVGSAGPPLRPGVDPIIPSNIAPPSLPEPQRTQVVHAMREINNLISHGLYTAAIEECLRVIEIAPQYLEAHQAMAEIYVHQGKIDLAFTKYNILIKTYLINGRVDDAIATYRRMLQLEPNNFNYRVQLINLLAQHGRAEEMLRERVAAADSFLKLGYPDRAIEQFEQALVAAPNDLELRQNYALALIRAGKVSQGINELQRLLQVDPANTLALARWQIVLASGAGMSSNGALGVSGVRMMGGEANNRVAALEVLSRLARTLRAERQRSVEEVVREYLTQIDMTPTNGDLRYALAVVYHAANRPAEAVQYYQGTLATPGIEVLARVGAAMASLANNDPTVAVQHLEEALATVRRAPIAPTLWAARPRLDGEDALAPDVEITYLLSRAYQRSNPGAGLQPGIAGGMSSPGLSMGQSLGQSMGQNRTVAGSFSDEIARAIGEISARHSKDPAAALQEMVQLVRQYRNQRQYEQAILVLNEITRIVPEDASVRAELADIHLKRGLLDEGIEELRRSADIHMRQGHTAEAAQALQQVGEVQWQMGLHEPALQTLKQVLQLTPDDMATRTLYVQYCLEQGQRKEAADQQTVLARYYYHQRQTKDAVATLQQLIALDATNYEAYDLLGQTFFSVGEYEQALRVYRQLAKINPSSAIARDRINQIQDISQPRR